MQEEENKNLTDRKVKAVILAGGKGTRGKPYTDFFPKAMIPISGKPLIHYIIKHLEKYRFIDEILIVSDFEGLGGQIKNYLAEKKDGKKITFIQDSQRGTGGDLLHLKEKMKGSDFILWFVDNLCALDIEKMVKFFKLKKSQACIATRLQRKEETGFAMVDDGIIKKFIEKPERKLDMAECLGMYVLSGDILQRIEEKSSQKEINLSFDILEEISKEGKVSAFDIGDTKWLDVESPIIVDRNNKLAISIIKQME